MDTASGLNTAIPNAARICDFMPGGKDNFAADRNAAKRVMTVMTSQHFGLPAEPPPSLPALPCPHP